jgi:hypothetical protein
MRFLFPIAVLAAAFMLLAFAWTLDGWAFDRGQWNHDPETSAWFKSLKNGNGTSCCDRRPRLEGKPRRHLFDLCPRQLAHH